MSTPVTTPSGSTVTITTSLSGLPLLTVDRPGDDDAYRNVVVGFLAMDPSGLLGLMPTSPAVTYGLGPDTLRVIADVIEEAQASAPWAKVPE